ncbi:MAG: protoporphyrinogen oxidase [Cyanobacteria bacterium]|nr:protoporphyrinogen oxidase [Cyanobacteriota bacterium]
MLKQHYSEIIIGAGIAGLSYAYKSTSDFLLIEKSSQLGGSWQSRNYKNSIYEFGPNSFMNRSEGLEEMIDTIGFRDQVISHDFKKSKRYLCQNDQLKLASPGSLIFSDLLSLPAKLSVLREPFLSNKSQSDDESIHDFISRRFNAELADLLGHALKGIWAGDAKMLSAQAALPLLKDLESNYGSILAGFIQKPKSSKQHSKTLQTCSFIKGMSSFCEALGAYIGEEAILRGADARLISYDGERYLLEINSQQITCDHLVLATKAYQAAEFLSVVYPKLSELLNRIYYADIELNAFSLSRNLFNPNLLKTFDAFGFINANADSSLMGTIFSSELFPERRLANELLFTSFSRFARSQSPANELTRILQPYINTKLKVDDFKLIDQQLCKQAIPQYNIGYLSIISQINNELPASLKLLGNYIGGVAFKDTIQRSFELAGQAKSSSARMAL